MRADRERMERLLGPVLTAVHRRRMYCKIYGDLERRLGGGPALTSRSLFLSKGSSLTSKKCCSKGFKRFRVHRNMGFKKEEEEIYDKDLSNQCLQWSDEGRKIHIS